MATLTAPKLLTPALTPAGGRGEPTLGPRLAALALLLLLVVGVLYLLVDRVWIARYHYYQDHLAQHWGRLEQLQRMAASREPLEDLIARIRQDPQLTAQYLPQATPSLAAADLQQRVRTIVEAAGGTLQSIQSLPPVDESHVVKVPVSAAMVGDPDSLPKVLHGLESQTPLLFVDNVQVSARMTRVRLPSGRYANHTRVQMHVQFEVSGYLRQGGG